MGLCACVRRLAGLLGLSLVLGASPLARADVFVVTSGADAGPGTLRAAIENANAAAGPHTIEFAIPTSDPGYVPGSTDYWRISLTTPLPTLIQTTFVDGWSQRQPASPGLPIIELDGAAVGAGDGLVLGTSDCVVRGLTLVRFPGSGLVLEGATTQRCWVYGCNSGVDPFGLLSRPNGLDGVQLRQGAFRNRIGTNGNGTDDESERCILSGNGRNGLRAEGTAQDNMVAGCFIGADATGLLAIPNGAGGIVIANAERTIIGTDSSGDDFNVHERNLISGNTGAGIVIEGSPSTGSIVSGNFIGTDITGAAPLPNTGDGVVVSASPTVGEHRIGAGLGFNFDESQPNTIAFNALCGVIVTGGVDTSILSNSIYDNGELGIDLAPGGVRGVTDNDGAGDPDLGPNNLQNFPIVLSVSPEGVISVRLVSEPLTAYRIELFLNRLPDPSELGEGQLFLGGIDATTNAAGNTGIMMFSYDPSLYPDLIWVTATATELPPVRLRGAPLDAYDTLGGPTALPGSTSEFSIAVPFNFPPTAFPQIVDTFENTDVVITLEGSDPEMQPITSSIFSLPSSGTLLQFGTLDPILSVPTSVTDSGNRVVFRPNTDEVGSPYTTFQFRVNDGMSTSIPATVTVNVLPLNSPPVAMDDSYVTNEDTLLSTTDMTGVLFNDTDPDMDSLSAVLVAGPLNAQSFTLNADGSFSYSPSPNFHGLDGFTYQAIDPDGDLSNVAMVLITVNAVNDPPVAQDDMYNINEDSPLSVPAPGILSNDMDIDGGPLSASLVSGPANASSFTLNPDGSFSYSPESNFNGTDSFTYRAFDGMDQSNLATVTINIAPINDAPIAQNDSYMTDEDTPLTITAPGILENDDDADGDTLFAEIVSGPSSSAAFMLNDDGSFTYTPVMNFNGMDSFTYRAFDGQSRSGIATVMITVNPVNDVPIAMDDSYSTNEDTPLSVAAAEGVLRNDSDADNESLTAVIVSAPANAAAFNLAPDGSFTFTPVPDFFGETSFTYRAADAVSSSNVATVRITVNPVNDPPTARCRNIVIDARTECLSLFITVDQVDNDSSDPEDGMNITRIVSNLGPFAPGETLITLTVTDSGGLSDTCTATVTVLAEDCQPNGIPDSCEVAGGELDCNMNVIPDTCECFWDNGEPPLDGTAANGQLSHEGGGAPLGAKAAEDFYLRPGEVHRINGFTGYLLTDSHAQIRRARVEFYNDCNGKPEGDPIAVFDESEIVNVTPSLNGFDLVTFFFDLCDEGLWLEGGRTYWVSFYGVTDNQMTDLSFWAIDEASGPHALAGTPPRKAEGLPTGTWGEFDYGDWEPVEDCCVGCVNLAFKLRGESCKVLWDNGRPDLGQGKGGSPSGANRSRVNRTADNFVTATCQDEAVCLIQAWIWTNCDPVHGFIELYENDCKLPYGSPVYSAAPTRVIATGETVRINGATYQGYCLELEMPGWTLLQGRNYWLAAGAHSTGNFNTSAFFAHSARPCTDPCRDPKITPGAIRETSPTPSSWAFTSRDYAFRIAIRQAPVMQPSTDPGTPSGPACLADSDGSGLVEVTDIFTFLSAWFAGCP